MAYEWSTLTEALADSTTNADLETIITNMQDAMAADPTRFGTVQLKAVNDWLNQYDNGKAFPINFYVVGTGASNFSFFAGIFPAVLPAPSTNYKIYNGIISQAGTAAPVVTIFDNTIGDIVWSRATTGVYKGTLAGAFIPTTLILTGQDEETKGSLFAFQRASSKNEIIIETAYPSANTTTGNIIINPSDGLMKNFPFEIRIYA